MQHGQFLFSLLVYKFCSYSYLNFLLQFIYWPASLIENRIEEEALLVQGQLIPQATLTAMKHSCRQ